MAKLRVDISNVVASLLLLFVIFTFLCRIGVRAGMPTMWLDELSVCYAYASKSVAVLLRSPVSLSYLLCKFFDWIEPNDFSVRIPIVLGALLVLVGTYATVAQFGSRFLAVATTWVVLWHPLFVYNALQNRFYIPGLGLMLVAWSCALNAYRREGTWRWLCYVAAALFAAHMWPWGSPWIGLMALWFGVCLTVRWWHSRHKSGSQSRYLVGAAALTLPVVFFGIHYLLARGVVESIGTVNDSWWREPKQISLKYLLEVLRYAYEPLASGHADILIGLLCAGLVLATLACRWHITAFALVSLCTWFVAIYMCNRAQVDPIPRRTMFIHVNSVILLFAGPAVLINVGHTCLRRISSGVPPVLRLVGTVFLTILLTCWMLWYGFDRMVITSKSIVLDHGPPFKQYAAMLGLCFKDGAHIILEEDGSGLIWGMNRYAFHNAPITNAVYKPYWTNVNPSDKLTAVEFASVMSNASQAWIIRQQNRQNTELQQMLERNAVRLPSAHEIWWWEPRFADMNAGHKRHVVRQLLLDVNERLPQPDIPSPAISNLIESLNEREFDEIMPILLRSQSRTKEQYHRMAELLQKYGDDANATRVMQSPLRYISRHPSMFEWVANSLVALARNAGDDRCDPYELAALNAFASARLRGSTTAFRSMDALGHERALRQARINILPETPAFSAVKKPAWHLLLGGISRTSEWHEFLVPKTEYTQYQKSGVPTPGALEMLGYHGAPRCCLVSSQQAITEGIESFSVLTIARMPTNRELQVLLGRGIGQSPADSPWFISLEPASYLTFMVQFLDQLGTNFEVRVSCPWQSMFNESWLYIAGICDVRKQVLQLYVNGTQVSESTIPKGSSRNQMSMPLTIGALKAGAYSYLGTIREIAAFPRALSATEVGHVMQRVQEVRHRSPQASLTGVTPARQLKPGVNLVSNGDFTWGSKDWSHWWVEKACTNGIEFQRDFVRIANPDGGLAGIKQQIETPLLSGGVYRLRAQARCVGSADASSVLGARVAVFLPPQSEPEIVWLSQRNLWWEKTCVFTNTVTGRALLYVHMGYGKVCSTADVTDIVLEEWQADRWQPRTVVPLEKTNAPFARVQRQSQSKTLLYTSVWQAVREAVDGDTIRIDNGLYREEICFCGHPLQRGLNNLTILGVGDSPIIRVDIHDVANVNECAAELSGMHRLHLSNIVVWTVCDGYDMARVHNVLFNGCTDLLIEDCVFFSQVYGTGNIYRTFVATDAASNVCVRNSAIVTCDMTGSNVVHHTATHDAEPTLFENVLFAGQNVASLEVGDVILRNCVSPNTARDSNRGKRYGGLEITDSIDASTFLGEGDDPSTMLAHIRAALPQPRVNLLRNAGFSTLTGWGYWETARTQTNLVSIVAADYRETVGQRQALRIANPNAELVGVQQTVPVTSGAVYRLGGYARSLATNCSEIIFGGRVAFWLPPQPEQQLVWISEYTAWTPRQLVFTNQVSGTGLVYVHMGYGKVASTGEFTDIRLERVTDHR